MSSAAAEYDPTQLLRWEIERYQGVLDGVTETHRWVDGRGGVFEDLHMPEGVPINIVIEQKGIDELARVSLTRGVTYQGPISPEQAREAIIIRQEAIAVELGPVVISSQLL